ncbi:4-hydroxybutyrate dehydrogenase, partial [Ralstonia solanacearum]
MALIFYLTHVHLGFGTLGELGSECARVGIRRPLVVTDRGVA